MNHHEFAHQIAQTAPNHSDLIALGIKDASAAEMIAQYHVQPRGSQLELSFLGHDVVIEFIKIYDVSDLEIGMVDFLATPLYYGDYVQFAKVELDPMFISIGGEVVVNDWQRPDHVMWHCAMDGEHLFDALVITSQFLVLTMLNDDIYNDETLALSVAATAATAAGGEKYVSFYQMLLGV
ncbi:hypothetical protein GCM10027594_14220 [Hymenobacter agri]